MQKNTIDESLKSDAFAGGLLAFFILLKLALPFILVNPVYELHRDEYLHLDQAKHLTWGFQSVPPVTSIIAYVINILGGSVFWIRFISALIGAGTLIFTWQIIDELEGRLYAKTLAAVSLICCAIARLDLLFQPNAFDILCWTAVYFFLIKYINTKHARFLYLTAIALALGFLNKYSIAFLVIGLIPGLALSRERKIFKNKYLYFSALLVLIIISPNLIWQYQNHFPVISHMAELKATQLDKINRIDFLKDQILYYIAVLIVILSAFAGLTFYKGFKQFRWILIGYIISIALFTWFRAKGYYAAGLYPVLLAFGSIYLANILASGWKRYLRILVLILSPGFFILTMHFAYPILSPLEIISKRQRFKAIGLLRWEDGKQHDLPQDFADMLGWKELAIKVDSVYRSIPDKENTLILCNNYGEAGAINYYSSFKNINAVSYNADYMNWFKLDKPIKNVILVKEKENEKYIPTGFKKMGSIDNTLAREYGTVIYFFKDMEIDYRRVIQENLKQIK